MKQPAAPPTHSENQAAAYALLAAMCDMSREHYSGEWAPHLQDLLWSDVQRLLEGKEPKTLKSHEALMLGWLYDEAGGWWSWTRTDAKGPSFVPKEAWES